MNLTVIIVTYNRCQSLAKTLESVAASSLPVSVEWEVLVVDNNSTDQTLQVVEDFAPSIRVVFAICANQIRANRSD